VAALPAPNGREKTQWYFQRYVSHLPAAGEIVLFDRSWYNRAGVERVMGFCTQEEVEEFFRSVPEFERMLIRSGIILIKYWFSITDEEQQFRFHMRIEDPLKQWKLSPMDVESRRRWEDYTVAKEEMLERTHIPEAPWWVVEAVDKKKARLNCIAHLLDQIPYGDVERAPVVLPRACGMRIMSASRCRSICMCRSGIEEGIDARAIALALPLLSTVRIGFGQRATDAAPQAIIASGGELVAPWIVCPCRFVGDNPGSGV
jgi:polyphosphate kinase 2